MLATCDRIFPRHLDSVQKRKIKTLLIFIFFIYFKNFFNIYLLLRDREGDTEPEAGSRLRAVSTEPDAGLEPTHREIVTRAEVGRSTDRAPQAPGN